MSKRRVRRKDYQNEPTVTAEILDLSHEGRGIAKLDGKTQFISGALPGETVEYQYTRKHNNHDEGKVITVITASKDRVTPACEYFGTCGGCSLQHMSHELQISYKQKMLEDLLAHHDVSAATTVAPLEGPQFHYRRKARLSIKNVSKKGLTLVGFREQNGRYVCNMEACKILAEPFGDLILSFRELFSKMDANDKIPQMETSVFDNSKTVILRHLEDLSDADKDLLRQFSDDTGIIIYLQPGNMQTIHLFHPEEIDPHYYELENFGLKFYAKPEQFIQVNKVINEKMLTQALDWLNLKSDDNVLDLFCGIGNFSLAIAKSAGSVAGVEADISAVKQARLNAEENNIENSAFYVSNLFEALNTDEHPGMASEMAWMKRKFNKLLLDPPRSGAKEIIENYDLKGFESIVYVSCNPQTFVRDVVLLKQRGFTLEKVGMMDMFPQTQHVEVMGLFR